VKGEKKKKGGKEGNWKKEKEKVEMSEESIKIVAAEVR